MKFIPYGKQYIDEEDIRSVVDVLKSDWLTQGPKVQEFEDVVAQYHGCKYAVAFSNGTAALHGAHYVSTKFPFGKHGRVLNTEQRSLSHDATYEEYLALKDSYYEFITTPLTFVATANAGRYCGGTPKFVDIDRDTYCIDINKIEEAITDYTRAVVPVSYAGYPVDIKSIKELAKVKENNICVIYDACHAIGARRDGHGIADFADMTILSFHPVKHICTGEGGMVLTNNKDYYEKLLLFRNHGITKDPEKFINKSHGDWYYEMQELGFNYRMTDIQCALGISQMKKLDKFLYKRNMIAKAYNGAFKDISWIKTPPSIGNSWLNDEEFENLPSEPINLHSYHLYPLLVDDGVDRRALCEYLKKEMVGAQIHYIPVTEQPAYSAYVGSELPIIDEVYKGIITLPLFYELAFEQVWRIEELLSKFVL